MRLKAKLPAIVLGVPLAESENPFMSVPVGTLSANIEIEECENARLQVTGGRGEANTLVAGFFDSLVEVLDKICVKIDYSVEGAATRAGVYATLTTLLLHAIARYHGDTLDEWEIVELARNADPIDKPWGWGYVMDALRYTVSTGKIVVYRNDEEFAALTDYNSINVRVVEEYGPLSQVVGRDDVGPDPYNATVHLVGVSVLEAAVRIQEGGRIPEDIIPLQRLLAGITASYWGLPYPKEGCFYSPGLPGYFIKMCFS